MGRGGGLPRSGWRGEPEVDQRACVGYLRGPLGSVFVSCSLCHAAVTARAWHKLGTELQGCPEAPEAAAGPQHRAEGVWEGKPSRRCWMQPGVAVTVRCPCPGWFQARLTRHRHCVLRGNSFSSLSLPLPWGELSSVCLFISADLYKAAVRVSSFFNS